MMSFLFQEYQFFKTPLNVQKQPFPVVLHNGVLRNLTKFTAKQLCRTLFSYKIESSGPAT